MASKCILVLGVIVFLLKGAIAQDSLYCKEIDSTLSVSKSYFPFGVASGDPQYHSVVLWTCVYPRIEGDVNVDWELSTDTLFRNILLQGTVQAKRDQGYTIKVVPNALQPGLKYFYRFRYKSQYSAIGRTRTASQSPEKLSFGIVSCSSISWGYYNAYAALARERDLQAVIHLGDYIYEYGAEKYFNPKGIIRFNTFEELEHILDNLDPAMYDDMLPYLEENYNLAKPLWEKTIYQRIEDEIEKCMGLNLEQNDNLLHTIIFE